MNETLFENTMDFVDRLAEKYPGCRYDLIRLIQRVQMDDRNAISRAFSDMEVELRAARLAEAGNPTTAETASSNDKDE